MYIRIEKGSSVPISRQIADQIRAQCLAGLAQPGSCLPSVRQLAKELVVNVNTVVRVYERLAAEGLVEMKHGDGTFVLPPPTAKKVAAELDQQREQFWREYESTIRRGLLLGITVAEMRRELTKAASNTKKQVANDTASEKKHD